MKPKIYQQPISAWDSLALRSRGWQEYVTGMGRLLRNIQYAQSRKVWVE